MLSRKRTSYSRAWALARPRVICFDAIGTSWLQRRSSATKNQKSEYVSWAKIWCCSEIKAEHMVLSASTAPTAGHRFTMDLSRRMASAALITAGSTILAVNASSSLLRTRRSASKTKSNIPPIPWRSSEACYSRTWDRRRKNPTVPKWDILVRRDGLKKIDVCEVLRCNWLQAMENSVDPTHTYYLHSHNLKLKGAKDYVPFHYQPLSKIEFDLVIQPNWAGIQKQRVFAGDDVPAEAPHPLIFPNILFVPVRLGYALHFRTPIDDFNTQVYQFRFGPTQDGSIAEQPEDPPIEYVGTKNADGEFHLDNFASQDHMAWETQGPISDRAREHLGESDRGIIMFRKLLREQIQAVQNGGDPIGINMDPNKDEVIQLIQEGYSAFSFAAAREGQRA